MKSFNLIIKRDRVYSECSIKRYNATEGKEQEERLEQVARAKQEHGETQVLSAASITARNSKPRKPSSWLEVEKGIWQVRFCEIDSIMANSDYMLELAIKKAQNF